MAVLEKIRVKLGVFITVLIAVALLSFIIDPDTLQSTMSMFSSKYDVGALHPPPPPAPGHTHTAGGTVPPVHHTQCGTLRPSRSARPLHRKHSKDIHSGTAGSIVCRGVQTGENNPKAHTRTGKLSYITQPITQIQTNNKVYVVQHIKIVAECKKTQ